AAAKEHVDFDSLIVCFLSHGKEGRLYAKDKHFDEKKLWNRFYESEALFGKPKLFFIQVMEKHSETLDLAKMLTMVAQIIAFDFKSTHNESLKNDKKQMPTIRSTLTGEVYLKRRPK
ncbi:unnamed protein product, partial [Darwinula stevensoni]